MSKIEDKLTDLTNIKTALKNAINAKLTCSGVPHIDNTTPFADYAGFITTYLRECEEQVNKYSVKILVKSSEYTIGNSASVTKDGVTKTVSRTTSSGYYVFGEIEAGSRVAISGVSPQNGYNISGVTGTNTTYSNGVITVSSTPDSDLTIGITTTRISYTLSLTYGLPGSQTTVTCGNKHYGDSVSLNDFGVTEQTIEVQGYNTIMPTFHSVTGNDAYVVNYEAKPAEVYYYYAVIPTNFKEPYPRVDFENATQVTKITTTEKDLDFRNISYPDEDYCLYLVAAVPSGYKAYLKTIQLGVKVKDELFDKEGTYYEDKIDYMNIPDGYKPLIIAPCNANGYVQPSLIIEE